MGDYIRQDPAFAEAFDRIRDLLADIAASYLKLAPAAVVELFRLLHTHRDDLRQPAEVFRLGSDGKPVAITHFNDARRDAIAWGAAEPFEFKGAHVGQGELAMVEVSAGGVAYEYAVLVTSLHDGVPTLAQHYRDRADAENVVIRADNPDRAVRFQQTLGGSKPVAGKAVVDGKAGKLIPMIVNSVDL